MPKHFPEKKHGHSLSGHAQKGHCAASSGVPSQQNTAFQPHHDGENAPRLNKAIAQSGFCSRRRADELIFAGKILVNGSVEKNPARRLLPNDTLAIDGQILSWHITTHCSLLLNKPVHTVSTAHDPEGRQTVLDLLPPRYQKLRLFPVGRLDYFSEGLLILTNDGDLANLLMHPRHHIPKIYDVTVRGTVRESLLKRMQEGMTLHDGETLLPVQVHALPMHSGTTTLRMTLRQGINRQIRRMCEDMHLTILRLVRIAQGPLSLGDLESGHVREITAREMEKIKKALQE